VITALGFQAPFKAEKLLNSRVTIRASSRTSLYAMISGICSDRLCNADCGLLSVSCCINCNVV
jgi:hypothetical protein